MLSSPMRPFAMMNHYCSQTVEQFWLTCQSRKNALTASTRLFLEVHHRAAFGDRRLRGGLDDYSNHIQDVSHLLAHKAFSSAQSLRGQ